MIKYDTIFLDRDGTLNPDPGYIRNLEQFIFYPFTIEALSRMKQSGKRFCIVTNQSGIGRGWINQQDLDDIHNFIKNEFKKNMIPLLDIYVCPDAPNQPSLHRKPGPGMFLDAARDHDIVLENSLMIGDKQADILAGKNLEMNTMLVLTGEGKKTKVELGSELPTYIVKDLLDGAKVLEGEHS